jgi:hypothetical protein
MKRAFILLLTVILATYAGYGQAWQSSYNNHKQKIAVYMNDEAIGVSSMIRSRFEAAILRQGNYQMVERTADFLAQLQKEQVYQLSGNVDDSQILRLGKQLGAEVMCAILITVGWDRYHIEAKLINVETAEVLATTGGSAGMKNAGEVTAVADKLATELLGMEYVKAIKGFHLETEGFFTLGGNWGANLAMGYRFNRYLAVGAGCGYAAYSGEESKGQTIPVFAGLRVNVLRYMLSPYVAIAGGVGLDSYTNTDTYATSNGTTIRNSEHQALFGYYNAAAGLHLRCADAFAIYAGVNYNNITNAPAIVAGIAITFL